MSINEIVKKSILLVICLVYSQLAQADALLDFGVIYNGDTFSTSTASTETKYFYNAGLMFNLESQRRWYVGWTVFGISQTNTLGTADTSYTSLDMGPILRWNIDRAGIYSMSAAYGYLARGTYAVTGSSSEAWEGTSLLGQIAVQAPFREAKFSIGATLNYYSATYTKKIVNRTESSNSSQKSWIFPMLTVTWRP